MSSIGGIGSTLTGGIQDIAAFLPLLGTEQCAIHVSSALTRGYLYAASAPMSIFGSLGVVSAGFRTLVACFASRLATVRFRTFWTMFEPEPEHNVRGSVRLNHRTWTWMEVQVRWFSRTWTLCSNLNILWWSKYIGLCLCLLCLHQL